MSHAETVLKQLAKELASRCNVPVPTVTETSRAAVGAYEPRTQEITAAVTSARGMVPSFLHQFAHHVANVRGLGPWHDAEFTEVLEEVATAHYGNAALYPWKTETVASLRYKDANTEEL